MEFALNMLYPLGVMGNVATIEEIQASIKDLVESQKHTDKQLKQTDKQLKQTDRQLRKLEALFTGQWGKLIESLVEGILVKLLNDRNIEVEKTLPRVVSEKKGGFEFDIIAINGREVVAVEVKTTLKPKDVDYFLTKLDVFKKIFPEYSNKYVYGAVAYLVDHSNASKYSEKHGLFVIKATGNSASIVNKKDFESKAF